MCGIWAVFGSSEDVSKQCLCLQKISHRGPDAFRVENINHFQSCCLGFRRLAIVDDVRGMQPMRLYRHPHVFMIYNGEIYNYMLLRKEFNLNCITECDGEPIIPLYDSHGPEFMAKQLGGVFAFCIFDTANRKVIIGRDTFGVRPLFTMKTSDGFLAICSEAKGLMEMVHGRPTGSVVIEPFPPGHVEVYNVDSEGRAHFHERTRFHKIGQPPLYKSLAPPRTADIGENIRNLFEEAVKKRLMADRRIGCLLSGGLDSSLVAAVLVKLAKEAGLKYSIQTFSVGMEGSPDLKAARQVAEYLQTEHHEIIFTPEEGLAVIEDVIYHLESYDITTVRASVGMYLVSRYIKQKTDTTVILSGEGSDEVLQGYLYFHSAPSTQAADMEARRLLHDLYLYDVLRSDRVTAAWGLEVRVPFLDHELTAYLLSLPPELRQPKDGMEKYLLRSAFAETRLLPDNILWRRKEAFSDGVASTAKSWYEIVADHCKLEVKESEFKQADALYPFNKPPTLEAFYYRRLFEQQYPGRADWIPYFWMPKWSATTDPSARTLKLYQEDSAARPEVKI